MTTRYPGRGLHGQTVEAIAGRVLGGTMPEGRPIDVEAQRRDDDYLTALGEALDAMASAGSRVALAVAADLALHRALLAAAHNEMLARWLS